MDHDNERRQMNRRKPMEHDDRCNVQDRDLTLLKEQFRNSTETLREVVDRVQELVLQFHSQNVAQATMAGDVTHIKEKTDDIEESLKKNYAFRSEFKEVKSEWRRFLGIILSALVIALIGWVLKGGLK